MNLKSITTQAGQTILDLAAQEYGVSTIEAANAIVNDNPEIFTEGISTLVPANVSIKIREDPPFADKKRLNLFNQKQFNSTYKSGVSNIPLPDDSGEIENPPETVKIIIGIRGHYRIQLHMAWKENGNVFGGNIVALADAKGAEAGMIADLPTVRNSDPQMPLSIAADYEGDNIVLTLKTSNVTVIKYKIISRI